MRKEFYFVNNMKLHQRTHTHTDRRMNEWMCSVRCTYSYTNNTIIEIVCTERPSRNSHPTSTFHETMKEDKTTQRRRTMAKKNPTKHKRQFMVEQTKARIQTRKWLYIRRENVAKWKTISQLLVGPMVECIKNAVAIASVCHLIRTLQIFAMVRPWWRQWWTQVV